MKRGLYFHTKEFKILLSIAVQESHRQAYTEASDLSTEKGRTRVLSTLNKGQLGAKLKAFLQIVEKALTQYQWHRALKR